MLHKLRQMPAVNYSKLWIPCGSISSFLAHSEWHNDIFHNVSKLVKSESLNFVKQKKSHEILLN